MTRTARASFPRAIIKDRAESKTGMDKHTPKNGAGPHNWGSLADERELEDAAEFDEEVDVEEVAGVRSESEPRPAPVERRASSVTEEDRQNAREFRKKALKSGEIDLSAIARTSSAVSTSPPISIPVMSDADTSSTKSL